MNLPGFTAEAGLMDSGQQYRRPHARQLRSQHAAKQSIIPAQVFRGCYYGLTAYFDCDIAGFNGVANGSWQWYVCDNRYCNQGGIGLVTQR
jgi:hypothetical protein